MRRPERATFVIHSGEGQTLIQLSGFSEKYEMPHSAALNRAAKLLIPDKWRIANHHIEITHRMTVQCEKIALQKILCRNAKLVLQLGADLLVYRMVDLDAGNGLRGFTAEPRYVFTSGAQENTATETRVKAAIRRGA